MNKPLLVLDCHYLCHRAFHAQKDLSWGGIATGVIYGFLKSIGHLKNEFQTDRVAFCFEGTTLMRKTWFPDYKMKRIHAEAADPVKAKARSDLTFQIDQLRIHHLRMIGFKNILYAPGYEADDIMARISEECEGEVVLVTSDADLYQCLKPNVIMYSPQKQRVFSDKWFRMEYGIEPWQWAIVKAMAGCNTDNVPGIPGIGEVTALKFLRGELKKDSKAYQMIKSPEAGRIVERNRKLVELPFEASPSSDLVEDLVSAKGWNEVCGKLGIKSLTDRPPVFSRKSLKVE